MPTSFGKIYRSCQCFKVEKDLCSKNEVLSTENVDFEGRQVSVSKYVIDDPCTRYDGLRPSDFALENQSLVGVKFQPVRCSLQPSEIDSEINRVNLLSNEE